MNVNFAITSPTDWAKEALDARNAGIISPGIRGAGNWATSRTVWARMISSAKINGDESLRKSNVLWVGNYQNNYGQSNSAEVGSLTNYSNSYKSITHRPKAGIDSLKIDFKGTMGSTRSCTVSFKCWDLDDLEVIEKLYMVPGISLIVEWGWSLTPDGTPVHPNDTLINLSPERDPFRTAMGKIIKWREVFRGSYDGLIGMITNFNYKLNENLGFDCEVELVSPGEMWLEQNATNSSKGCSTEDNSKQQAHSNLEFAFHDIYSNNKEKGDPETVNKLHNNCTVCIIQEWETETREYDKNHREWYSMDSISEGANGLVGNTATTHPEVYISWAMFVKTLNDNINLFVYGTDPAIAPESRRAQSPTVSLALDLIPVTILPKFFSLDPTICTFKPIAVDVARGNSREYELATADEKEVKVEQTTNKDGSKTIKETVVEPDLFSWASIKSALGDLWQNITYSAGKIVDRVAMEQDQEIRSVSPENSLPELTDLEFAKAQINAATLGTQADVDSLNENKDFVLDSNVGLLNNVYLNAGFLRDCVMPSAGDTLTMQDYLSKVLGDLNIATGNIWDLQYYVDEADGTRLHIYDANYTSSDSRKNIIKPYKFSLQGANAVLNMRGADVESKLVDGYKSMVLYANNTKDNGNNDNANDAMGLYGVNPKIIDGFRITDSQNPTTSSEICIDAKGKTKKSTLVQDKPADLDYAYVLLLRAADPETITAAKNSMQQYIAWLNTDKANKEIAKKLPRNQNILLPFNFSVTIDGFSGFSWGNAIEFDYLPSRYGNRIYFQITKIKHDVSVSDWTTSIETVMRLRPE